MKPVLGFAIVSAVGFGAYVINSAFQPSNRATIQDVENDGCHALILRDNRVLEYFIHGDECGDKTLVSLHGAQTTGKLFSILDAWGKENYVKIIAPTLPGFGLSTFKKDYTLDEWVQDMREFLPHVNANSFHLLGTSLGSIHAAALTSLYEPRDVIKNVELYVAFGAPTIDNDPLQASVLQFFANMAKYPLVKRLLEAYLIRPMLLLFTKKTNDVNRAIRNQWEGMASCAHVIYQPWSFDYKSMAKNRKVIVVSGTKDNAAPPHNQQWLIKNIPGSTLVEYEGSHERGIEEPDMMARHLDLLFE
jgi:pimeloyl-ACP methyl ester carboxylesterase